MKVFFENNKEIPKLTLVECMVMLGEERHHADFLDGLKEKLTGKFAKFVKKIVYL